MKLGRLGVWYSADKLNGAQLAELMKVIEATGYSSFWHPERRGFEAMSLGPVVNGMPTLLIASDDNNQKMQKTAFLLLGMR